VRDERERELWMFNCSLRQRVERNLSGFVECSDVCVCVCVRERERERERERDVGFVD